MTPHPLDEAVDVLAAADRRFDRLGSLTPEEQEIRDQIQDALRTLGAYRRRQFAGEALIRNGDSRYVRELLADAGIVLPRVRAVVPFPDRHDPQAA